MINSKIEISILTVVKNDFKKIEKTIQSVVYFKKISSNYNIKFYLIDGNSGDGTKEICEKYKSQTEVFISENDSGLYEAINKGLQLIKTNAHVLCLNSGDILLNLDLIDHNYFLTDIVLCSVLASSGKLLIPKVDLPINARTLFPSNKYWHQGFFIRRNKIYDIGFYRTDVGMQADGLFMTLATSTLDFRICPIPASIFDLNGISNTDIIGNIKSYFKVIDALRLNKYIVILLKVKMFSKLLIKYFLK
jgi:hypothetical protein